MNYIDMIFFIFRLSLKKFWFVVYVGKLLYFKTLPKNSKKKIFLYSE